jgi:hypothetical protein
MAKEHAGQDSDVKEALELCGEIDDLADTIREHNPKGEEFAASVQDKASSMAEWIEANNRVTEKMMDTLRNMKAGLEKWNR